MPVKVRPYDPADEGYWHVRSLTYNNGIPIPPENRTMKARNYVAEEGGEIRGVYVSLDLTCTCRGAVLDTGGIAGVGVHPAARGGGVGSAMMRHAIRDMREHGIPMASLYAYREWFYRKFGYESCGSRMELSVPVNRLPHLPAELPMRDYPASDFEKIADCHKAFVLARNGGSLRGERLWERVVNEKTRIYAAGDPVEGYALVQHEVDFWVPQRVQEIGWSTAAGYRAILGLLANLGVNKTCVEWYEPGDSPYLAAYLDQGATVSWKRQVMYRVTDVPVALRAISASCSGSFTFEVVDDLVPENRGPWQVSFSPSGVEVEAASSADLTFSIQAFAQALLGEPSLVDLARNGLIDVRSRAALDAAVALLPASRVYCLEFF